MVFKFGGTGGEIAVECENISCCGPEKLTFDCLEGMTGTGNGG